LKFTRFEDKKDKKLRWGLVAGDHIDVISGSPFDKWEKTDESFKVYDVRMVTPCDPSKIICTGLNYKDHAKELKMEVPDEPILFMKPSSSVIGPEDYIVKPKMCEKLEYEAELAAVMGKTAKDVPVEEIPDYILGYTCINDVTARDLQKIDGQWTRSKSFDTFAPIGPVIAAGVDPNRLKIELYLNEDLKQSSDTSNLIFKVEKLISFISCVMTLNPGDVIATGTPVGVGPMSPGDVVEVVIEKIGALRNYVTE